MSHRVAPDGHASAALSAKLNGSFRKW